MKFIGHSARMRLGSGPENKGHLNVNYSFFLQILYWYTPFIHGTTMWKLGSWAFEKCGSFWVWKFLKGSYWLSKLSHFSIFLTAKCGVKKRHGHNFESSDPPWIGGLVNPIDYPILLFNYHIFIILRTWAFTWWYPGYVFLYQNLK